MAWKDCLNCYWFVNVYGFPLPECYCRRYETEIKNIKRENGHCDSWWHKEDRWISLTDDIIVNHYRKVILVHDFTATKKLNLERCKELGYSIEFETDPYS
ncbi:hypothetical protein DRP04_06870 [Archaeoglobales archaeon]|nr:MAG: hypothetical protein DRP04_06870 [Archaeoglobales archaeon]